MTARGPVPTLKPGVNEGNVVANEVDKSLLGAGVGGTSFKLREDLDLETKFQIQIQIFFFENCVRVQWC